MDIRGLAWFLWLFVRALWARFRCRPLLLSEGATDRLLGLLSLPGFPPAALAFPRDLAAARRALTRSRLGADVVVVTASLWDSFCVVPSDIAGYAGPVRMVLVHEQGGYLTAIPWSVPASFAAAREKARTVTALFEDDDSGAGEVFEDKVPA